MVALYRLALVHELTDIEPIPENNLDIARAPGAPAPGLIALLVEELRELVEALSLLPFREHLFHDCGLFRLNLNALFIRAIPVAEGANSGGLISGLCFDSTASSELQRNAHALVYIQRLHDCVDEIIIRVFGVKVVFGLFNADDSRLALHELAPDDCFGHIRAPQPGSVQHDNNIPGLQHGEHFHERLALADCLIVIGIL